MSLGVNFNPMGSHLKDAQGGEIPLRWLSPRIIEQVDGRDDDGGIPAKSVAHKPRPSMESAEPHTFRNAQATPSMVLDPSRL